MFYLYPFRTLLCSRTKSTEYIIHSNRCAVKKRSRAGKQKRVNALAIDSRRMHINRSCRRKWQEYYSINAGSQRFVLHSVLYRWWIFEVSMWVTSFIDVLRFCSKKGLTGLNTWPVFPSNSTTFSLITCDLHSDHDENLNLSFGQYSVFYGSVWII